MDHPNTRAARRQHRKRVIANRLKLLRLTRKQWGSPALRLAIIPLIAGKLGKRKPYDCGRPRCGVCHGGKRFGLKSFYDLRRMSAITDEITEAGE